MTRSDASARHPHHPRNDPEDLDLLVAQIDGIHLGVGRLKLDAVGFDIEALEGDLLSLDQCDDHFAVFGCLPLLDRSKLDLRPPFARHYDLFYTVIRHLEFR